MVQFSQKNTKKMYLEDSSQKLERSKKILFDILNPIKAGRFSGGDQLGGGSCEPPLGI